MALSQMDLLMLLAGYPNVPLNVRQPIISPPGIPNQPGAPPSVVAPPPGFTPVIPLPPLPGQDVGGGGEDRGRPSTGESELSDWGPGEKPGGSTTTSTP